MLEEKKCIPVDVGVDRGGLAGASGVASLGLLRVTGGGATNGDGGGGGGINILKRYKCQHCPKINLKEI